jgi:hypothetical protein
VKDRAAVVALAGVVASEGEARFVVNAVAIARQLGTAGDPVVALDVAGPLVVARTRSGRLAVPAPVDYLVWTEAVRGFAERTDLRGARREVLATGSASRRAREGLTASAWPPVAHCRHSGHDRKIAGDPVVNIM